MKPEEKNIERTMKFWTEERCGKVRGEARDADNYF